MGSGFRKIRLAITSKNKGKSGYNITHEIILNTEFISVPFVAIYDKSDFDTIDMSVIRKITEKFREI